MTLTLDELQRAITFWTAARDRAPEGERAAYTAQLQRLARLVDDATTGGAI